MLRLQVCITSQPRTTLSSLSSDDPLSVLISAILALLPPGSEVSSIKRGFPPREVDLTSPTASLGSLGVKSGDSLTVTTGNPPSSTSVLSTGSAVQTSSPTSSQPTMLSSTSRPSLQAYRKHIPDDNNCLFSALAYAVSPSDPAPATELRTMVAAAVLSDDRWDEVCLGMKPQVYADKIGSTTAWGGEVELVILSEMLGIRVWVSNVETGMVLKYEPESLPDADIVILFYSGIHYDVFAVNTPMRSMNPVTATPKDYDLAFSRVQHAQSRTRFKDNDPAIAELSALTKMLTKAHEFTSIAKFTIRCETCKVGLTGTKGAQEHMSATGHTHFQEY